MSALLAVLITLWAVSGRARAAELYGLDLATAERATLGPAVQRAGAKLVRERTSPSDYDVYQAPGLVPGSRNLYLGFVPDSGAFAFLEYEISTHLFGHYVGLLSAKYGPPRTVAGTFPSSARHTWQDAGVDILAYVDHAAGFVRLVYSQPANLEQLRSAQAAAREAEQEETRAAGAAFY